MKNDDSKPAREAKSTKFLLLGGGLANGILALKLKSVGFEDFVLVEKSSVFGGNHTWSFHGTDLSEGDLKLLQPMLHGSWLNQWVHFKKYSRNVPIPYYSIRSDLFDRELRARLNSDQYVLQGEFERTSNTTGNVVTPSEMLNVSFEVLFNGTGAGHEFFSPCGYQKFVGLEVELETPHGLDSPVIMDATVDQKDGFRFMYSLPFSEKTVLVEDTRYSTGARIEIGDFENEVRNYIETNFGKIKSVLRREVESLPIPLQPKQFEDSEFEVQVGLRGGLFQPVTGYSVPLALRFSNLVADLAKASCPNSQILRETAKFKRVWGKNATFFFVLNRMLFGAAHDNERVKIFERFYKLSTDLVGRFYSGRMLKRDQLRILVGKPPVRISRAIKSLTTESWMRDLNLQ